MNKQQAIALYRNRAASLMAYKRHALTSNPARAYKAQELAFYLNTMARNLSAMNSADYYRARRLWIDTCRSASKYAPNRRSASKRMNGNADSGGFEIDVNQTALF